MGDVFIDEWGIFGAEVFLHYSRFFVKGDFVIGGAACNCYFMSVVTIFRNRQKDIFFFKFCSILRLYWSRFSTE